MEIIKNTIFNSATYILSNSITKEVLLIDCGDIAPIVNYIDEHQLQLKGVFLTHSHFDHIYGLNELAHRYSHFPIYTSQHGAEGLKNPKLNMSRYHEGIQDFIYENENIEILAEGKKINIGEENIQVMETPGHDWSCLTYQIGKYLFTGDSYIPKAKPQFNFPKGNKKLYFLSEERIINVAKTENLTIMPGHIC